MKTRDKRSAVSTAVPTKTRDFSLVQYMNEAGGDVQKILARLTVEKARAGDTDAAYAVLQDFVGAIDQYSERTWQGPVHWEYARYLADAFAKIVRAEMKSASWSGPKWDDVRTGEGEIEADANLALGIKTSKAGRRKGTKMHKTTALAALYWYLVRRGFKPEQANKLIRERIRCDRKSIQNASKRDGNEAYRFPKLFDDESLKDTFAPYAAHAKAIIEEEEQRIQLHRQRKMGK